MSEVTQLAESLHPHEVKVVSALKPSAQREGLTEEDLAKAIGAGGLVQSTSAASVTADSLQRLIRFVHEAPKPLSEFPQSDQALIEKFAQKRGKPKETFRVDDRVIRTYGLQELGHAVALQIQKEGVRKEATRLTPEMLKDGSW